MGESTHFSGRPVYGQQVKSLDCAKIVAKTAEKGTLRALIAMFVLIMFFTVIMRFDSLREV